MPYQPEPPRSVDGTHYKPQLTQKQILKFSDLNHLSLPEAAYRLAEAGHPVFPLSPGRKTPLLRGSWLDHASADPAAVDLMWVQHPSANIAFRCGVTMDAIDLDLHDGRNGYGSYLQMGGDPVPRQLTQRTPNGIHLFIPPRGCRVNFANRGEFGGIDYRGENAYVVAGPSVVGGVQYQWIDGDILAPLPADLEQFLASSKRKGSEIGEMPAPEDLSEAEALELVRGLEPEWRDFLLAGVHHDNDHSRVAYWTVDQLTRRGWSLERLLGVLPYTYLGELGAKPPHSAANPLKWLYKYVITPAVSAVSRQREALFSVLPDEGGENPATTIPAPPVEPDPYTTLDTRAESIEEHDLQACEVFVRDVLLAGLVPYREEALLRKAARFSRFPISQIDGIRKHLSNVANSAKKPASSPPFVWVADQNRALDIRSDALLTKEGLATSLAREHGGSAETVIDRLFLSTDALCPTVASLTYHPGLPAGIARDPSGRTLYNTYRHSPLLPQRGDVSPWLSLLEALRPQGGKATQERILDTVAWWIQNPGRKANHGLLIGGKHGIGKDSFFAPVLRAFGEHNCRTVHGEELSGTFNDFVARNKLLVINELDYGDHNARRSISEKLKPYLAAPPTEIRVNEKNQRPYSIPNVVQVVAYSNHRIPGHFDPGERRWYAVWCEQQIPEDPEHPYAKAWASWFRDYWLWLDQGGAAAVFNHLLERDVSRFSPGERPPQTEWYHSIVDSGRDPLESWILERVRRAEGVWSAPLIELETIMIEVQYASGLTRYPPTRAQMGRAMTKAGFRALPRTRGLLQRSTVYQIRGVPEGMQEKALEELQKVRDLPLGPTGLDRWTSEIPFSRV